MGPVRRRLSRALGDFPKSGREHRATPRRSPQGKRALAALCLLPSPAFAQDCATLRPSWDGAPVSALSEALLLFSTPLSLILLLATALVFRFRSNWGALVLAAGWSLQVYLVTFALPTDAAKAQGCIGSPVLFILAASALAVGAVVYTGPPPRPDDG